MSKWAVTAEQERYILAHLNDRPRAAVARKAGVGKGTVYRLVREHGGELRRDLSTRNPEWERIVRENYREMSGHEIERRFGITPGRANKIAQQLRLRHSPECEERLKREAYGRIRDRGHTPEARAKAARTWKARRRMDEMRSWEGRPQQTRLPLAKTTRRAYKAKWRLAAEHGYLTSAADPYAMLYDGRTRRLTGRTADGRAWPFDERYYEQKYKLKFKPAVS